MDPDAGGIALLHRRGDGVGQVTVAAQALTDEARGRPGGRGQQGAGLGEQHRGLEGPTAKVIYENNNTVICSQDLRLTR